MVPHKVRRFSLPVQTLSQFWVERTVIQLIFFEIFGTQISRRSCRLRCKNTRLPDHTLATHPVHPAIKYVARAVAVTNIALLSTSSKSLALSWNWCLSSFCATSRTSTTARKHSSSAAACAVAILTSAGCGAAASAGRSALLVTARCSAERIFLQHRAPDPNEL